MIILWQEAKAKTPKAHASTTFKLAYIHDTCVRVARTKSQNPQSAMQALLAVYIHTRHARDTPQSKTLAKKHLE
jgi:hypothetical protein